MKIDKSTPSNFDPTEWHTGVITKGVGPWEENHTSPPPKEIKYDPDLLKNGDSRNVVDYYRYWTVEAIVADLEPKRHEFHVAIENLAYDNNIGTIVRTANAFLAKAVHIVGKKKWNRRSAMVTDKYQPIYHHETSDEFVKWCQTNNLTIVAVDNDNNAEAIEKTKLPKNSMLVFGHEGFGVSDLIKANAGLCTSIAQFGSTRSINVGVAAGIIMHNWIRFHAKFENAW